MGVREPRLRRVAMISVHTSPLEQPGTGDAGGLNVYVVETARRLAERGTEVEVFTRATSGDLPPVDRLAPGVLVRNVVAGPFSGLSKNDLPGQPPVDPPQPVRIRGAARHSSQRAGRHRWSGTGRYRRAGRGVTPARSGLDSPATGVRTSRAPGPCGTFGGRRVDGRA